MKFNAVIFDLDGTLADTIDDLADSGNELLSRYNMAPHTVSEYKYFVGNGSRKLVERIMPDASPEKVDEALDEYKKIYDVHLLNKTKPYDGIIEMLFSLKERKVKMAVCTNKHMSAASKMIEKLFPSGMFDAFVGDRAGYPRKPDPANALYVMERIGAVPEKVAYLGDTAVDMETATRAGFLPVGVLWGFREKEELVKSGARVLLSHPMELLEKVDF